jgi:hypothetical protein
MAVTAQSIIDKVRTQLIDPSGSSSRWTDEELLSWVSDGQRAVVAYTAGSSSITYVHTLVAGTKQLIPTNGHQLLTVVRNMAADGVTPARATRIVTRDILDTQNPNWHTVSSSSVVQNYVFDLQEPRKFYVYPPNDGTGKVEIVYAIMPQELTSGSDILVLQEIYQTAVFDYVMFRAHQKDSDFAAGQAVAQNYLQLFLSYVTQNEQGELSNNPNLQLGPRDASSRGTSR